MRWNSKRSEDFDQEAPSQEQEVSWTETQMVVSQASLYPEETSEQKGRMAFSLLLELAEQPDSSSNPRNRMVFQLALGVEEKDIPTFARLLGRKVFLTHQQPVETLEREQLVLQLKEALDQNASLRRKVSYLNDSLHHYVQESR